MSKKQILILIFILFNNLLYSQSKEISYKIENKISSLSDSFKGILKDLDKFGKGVTSIGDLDRDGIGDLAVGAYGTDDGGDDKGAVWILFMNKDGTIKMKQKISENNGNFNGNFSETGEFGLSVTCLGDIDGDGINDLAVGEPRANDGGNRNGAVWIIFLKRDGTVKSKQKISQNSGNLNELLDDDVRFGQDVAGIGDLNKDGIPDLLVGTYGYSEGGIHNGAVFVLFMNHDGTVKNHQIINANKGNFNGVLNDNDYFGGAVASMGDIDNDGNVDIVVGAPINSDGGLNFGCIWIINLNSDGTVKNSNKISSINGNFKGILHTKDLFGAGITCIGDIDGDKINDIVVGARLDDDGGTDRGALWILCLNKNNTVKTYYKISGADVAFNNFLNNGSGLGWALTFMNDYNNDGLIEFAVGAHGDNGDGYTKGAVYIFSIKMPLLISDSIIMQSCYNSNDGKIIIKTDNAFGMKTMYSIDNAKTFQNDSIFSDLKAGKYILAVKNNTDTIFGDTVFIIQPQKFLALFPNDTLRINNNIHTITIGLSGGKQPFQFYWSNSSINNQTIEFNINSDDYIYVTVYDANHCSSSDSIYIKIEENCQINIPNAFTPDGDYLNDVYSAIGCDVSDYKMLIFNRWGDLIFESNKLLIGWDGKFNGKICPEGVYFCVVSYKDNFKHTRNLKSSLTLLR